MIITAKNLSNKVPAIIALDPSSTAIGYAVLGQIDGGLIDAGLITPDRKTHPPLVRILAMLEELTLLICETEPEAVVIEVTSGKVGKRHKGKGAGLAVYGMAVGAVWQLCRSVEFLEVAPVLENDWTDGKGKSKRLSLLCAMEPKYKRERDPGGDVGDAIGLGRWWLARQPKAGGH